MEDNKKDEEKNPSGENKWVTKEEMELLTDYSQIPYDFSNAGKGFVMHFSKPPKGLRPTQSGEKKQDDEKKP